MEAQLAALVENFKLQTQLLQQLVNPGVSIQTLDDNKKGEKEVPAIDQ